MVNELGAKDVYYIYDYLIGRAKAFFEKKEFDKVYHFVKSAAKWAYNFNLFFTDETAEEIVKYVSRAKIKSKKCKFSNDERYVLIDTCSVDNHGLHQQYLRAFEAIGASYLFITLRKDLSYLRETIAEISVYEKGFVWHYDGSSPDPFAKAESVSNAIFNFSPNRIFLHLMPSDIISLMAIYAIEGPVKYNINLTDHAFWLGASFVDYNIEFRAGGRTVSRDKRFFSESSLLNLPFYPIIQRDNYSEDLPAKEKKDIIIFTGGSPYKMMGRNDFFFKEIIDKLLDLSPNVKVWIAGFEKDSPLFREKQALMKNGNRMYNIGIRKDINHTFSKSDIFLGTYPFGGGLMTQYAAVNGKPILCYADETVPKLNILDDLINHFSTAMHTYSNLAEFISYAKKLISNKELRQVEGLRNREAMMYKEKFDELFKKVIVDGKNIIEWERKDIDYDKMSKLYLDIENNQMHSGVIELIADHKLKVLIYFTKYLPIILVTLSKLARKYFFDFRKIV